MKCQIESDLHLTKMAGVCRFARNLLAKNNAFSLQFSIVKHARCSSVVAGSTQHTLSVKRRIDKTRESALLGGGQKRIEKQHQKVPGVMVVLFTYFSLQQSLFILIDSFIYKNSEHA